MSDAKNINDNILVSESSMRMAKCKLIYYNCENEACCLMVYTLLTMVEGGLRGLYKEFTVINGLANRNKQLIIISLNINMELDREWMEGFMIKNQISDVISIFSNIKQLMSGQINYL